MGLDVSWSALMGYTARRMGWICTSMAMWRCCGTTFALNGGISPPTQVYATLGCSILVPYPLHPYMLAVMVPLLASSAGMKQQVSVLRRTMHGMIMRCHANAVRGGVNI